MMPVGSFENKFLGGEKSRYMIRHSTRPPFVFPTMCPRSLTANTELCLRRLSSGALTRRSSDVMHSNWYLRVPASIRCETAPRRDAGLAHCSRAGVRTRRKTTTF